MIYNAPLNLTAVSRRTIDDDIVPVLTENEKRYYVYTPPALIFVMFQYAEQLREMLKQSRIDFRKENRIIGNAIRGFVARWENRMRKGLQESFQRIVEELAALIGRDLAVLLFQADTELMQMEPDNANHLIISQAEVVKFMCGVIARRDRKAFDYLNVDMGIPRNTWFLDEAVADINDACNLIVNRLSLGNDVTDKITDKTLAQVKLAVRVIENKLDAYKITI